MSAIPLAYLIGYLGNETGIRKKACLKLMKVENEPIEDIIRRFFEKFQSKRKSIEEFTLKMEVSFIGLITLIRVITLNLNVSNSN